VRYTYIYTVYNIFELVFRAFRISVQLVSPIYWATIVSCGYVSVSVVSFVITFCPYRILWWELLPGLLRRWRLRYPYPSIQPLLRNKVGEHPLDARRDRWQQRCAHSLRNYVHLYIHTHIHIYYYILLQGIYRRRNVGDSTISSKSTKLLIYTSMCVHLLL
jgi:hypothetical protein